MTEPAPSSPASSGWRSRWQIPALVVAAGVLTSGLVYAVRHAPKPDLGTELKAAHELEAAGKYGEALDRLNAKVLPNLAAGVTDEQRQQFHLLRARSLYKGQLELGLNRPENNANIVREYDNAKAAKATLDENDYWYLAQTYMREGRIEEALNASTKFGESMHDRRVELMLTVLDESISGKRKNESRALELIHALLGDDKLAKPDRLKVIAHQTELLTRQGYPEDAVSKTVRALVGIDESPETAQARGEVHTALAKAYIAVNDSERALAQLELCGRLLPEGHASAPEVALMRARIERTLGEDGLAAAKDRCTYLIEHHELTPSATGAFLCRAEINAQLARTRPELLEESKADYDNAIAGLPRGGVTVDELRESLLARFRERFELEAYADALEFAMFAEKASGTESASVDTLLALAESNKHIAEQLIEEEGGNSALTLAQLDPATRREARRHLIAAGEYYRRHAGKVAQKDNGSYGSSLWFAADCFDRAGDLDASVSAFRDFAKDFPSDQRTAEARFRLGQSYQARGDLELASKEYRDLIAGRESMGYGSWADASMVPLARTYLSDGDDKNDSDAERLLVDVVTGAVGGTKTEAFRLALHELGEYYYRVGQYERAIERFEEFLRRAQAESAPGRNTIAKFKLADSCRLSASAVARELAAQDRPEGERRELINRRAERLDRAKSVYEELGRDLAGADGKSAIEELYERNASFYLGDCHFDLKDYEGAIRAYDAAKERYPKDPAALVAMIQIVNAHVELGQFERARTANARAKRFYESLPESVWDDPTLPMSRRDWERWLESQMKLGALASGE